MEKDAPSDAGTRADQSRPAGEESAPDGQLDALHRSHAGKNMNEIGG